MGKKRRKSIFPKVTNDLSLTGFGTEIWSHGIPGKPSVKGKLGRLVNRMSPHVLCEISEFYRDTVPWIRGKKTVTVF